MIVDKVIKRVKGTCCVHILVVSVNYRTAPVEFREKLTFQATELEQAMTTLQKQKSVLENVIVSTCNRTGFTLLSINYTRDGIILRSF